MLFNSSLGGDNEYLYNGKELQEDDLGGVILDWYDYGARMYDPALGRFTCLDPIAEEFYNVNPYNYAENRPINGIDLWGLQYLNHNDARIIARNGLLQIKTTNLHRFTQNRIKTLSKLGYWRPDSHGNPTLGYNTTLGEFNSSELAKDGPPPASLSNKSSDPNNKSSEFKHRGINRKGIRNIRQKGAPVTQGRTSGGKVASGSVLILNFINEGLELTTNLIIRSDMKLIDAQIKNELNSAITNLNAALGQEGMIPDKYRNREDLSAILNVILQGENTTEDKEIMNIGVTIIKEISKNYDETKIVN